MGPLGPAGSVGKQSKIIICQGFFIEVVLFICLGLFCFFIHFQVFNWRWKVFQIASYFSPQVASDFFLQSWERKFFLCSMLFWKPLAPFQKFRVLNFCCLLLCRRVKRLRFFFYNRLSLGRCAFSDNNVGDAGARALVEALKVNTALLDVSLKSVLHCAFLLCIGCLGWRASLAVLLHGLGQKDQEQKRERVGRTGAR